MTNTGTVPRLHKEFVEDSMKTSLTPDDDVTEKKKMKRELEKAKVQQQNKERDFIK